MIDDILSFRTKVSFNCIQKIKTPLTGLMYGLKEKTDVRGVCQLQLIYICGMAITQSMYAPGPHSSSDSMACY